MSADSPRAGQGRIRQTRCQRKDEGEAMRHQVRVLSEEEAVPTTCWAFWREGLPCPNQVAWRVQNRTNAGYSLMCDVHKDAFVAAQPQALVRYQRLEGEAGGAYG